MKKISLILPRFSRYGGVERFGYNLSAALADAGYSVDFICARAEDEPPQGVNIVKVGRYGFCRAGKLLWFVMAAEKARKKGNYDLTISLGKSLNQDILRIGGGPLESFWSLSQRAWPAGFARSFKMFRRRTALVNMLIKYIERKQAASDCRMVCVSHRVRDWMVDSHPSLSGRKIDVIYNKPDLSLFSPLSQEERNFTRAEFSLSEKDVLISTATTNFALKGVSFLIKALAELPANYHLQVAGGVIHPSTSSLQKSWALPNGCVFLVRSKICPRFTGVLIFLCCPHFTMPAPTQCSKHWPVEFR